MGDEVTVIQMPPCLQMTTRAKTKIPLLQQSCCIESTSLKTLRASLFFTLQSTMDKMGGQHTVLSKLHASPFISISQVACYIELLLFFLCPLF